MLFRSGIVALAASLAPLVQAQVQYTIEPDSVPSDTRDMWCDRQTDSCPMICQQTEPGTTEVNTCDPDTLTYGCLCGDNKKPNMSEYSLTLPYFMCQEWGNQCVADCSQNDNDCASSCRQDHPCGALDPSPPNASATTMAPTASQTDDGTIIYTGTPGGSDDEDGALALGRSHGLAIVFGVMFVGFAML